MFILKYLSFLRTVASNNANLRSENKYVQIVLVKK